MRLFALFRLLTADVSPKSNDGNVPHAVSLMKFGNGPRREPTEMTRKVRMKEKSNDDVNARDSRVIMYSTVRFSGSKIGKTCERGRERRERKHSHTHELVDEAPPTCVLLGKVVQAGSTCARV